MIGLFGLYSVCFCLGFGVCCWAPSWPAIGLTGLLLGLQTSCAHNWFHLRDSQVYTNPFFMLLRQRWSDNKIKCVIQKVCIFCYMVFSSSSIYIYLIHIIKTGIKSQGIHKILVTFRYYCIHICAPIS